MESKIGELRTVLKKEDNEFCDDAMVLRYLRATSGNVAKAAERIEASVQWRRQIQPESLVCKACVRDPSAHYMNVVGFCKIQRPVFYSCMKLSRSKDVEEGKIHLITQFEQAIRMMPDGVEQWVWVSDFFGFGMSDMSPAMARRFVDLTANHYPERLGAYLVVDAPTIFEGLWKLVKPWLDPVTVQKIIFVPNDIKKGSSQSRLYAKMHELFPKDLADWLICEIVENREKKIYTKKTSFVYSEAYKTAFNGGLKQIDGHDIRGTEIILKTYNANPALLLPQAEASK
eukprot:g1471.t1